MRYTTIIDISEVSDIYRNQNARLIYLHLALKSGYHAEDRDQIRISIRTLAYTTGVSVSACRHAIKQLEGAGLIKRTGNGLVIKKWLVEELPAPRTAPKKKGAASAEGARPSTSIGEQMEKNIEEYRAKVYAAVRDMTKEELTAWLAEMEDGRSLRHRGVTMRANEHNIQWLKDYIKKL